MQQRLFSNSISIGLSGKLGSNGFMYVMPLPVTVCLGVNDVLFGHNVKHTIPVFPGSTRMLFLTINEIEICWRYNCVMRNLTMQTVVPLMYILKLSRRDILSHTLTLLSELSGDLILMVF